MTSRTVIRVIDLETTGSRPSDSGVVEIGWQDVLVSEGPPILLGPPGALLVDPGVPISPQTAAIHHIIDEDVAGSPAWLEAAARILRPEDPGLHIEAFAAHRASFEQRWCTDRLTGGQPWICTYKSALRIWPDAPSHSNQSLRYWRKPAGLDRATGMPAHRAGPDAYVTAHHLRDMIEAAGLAALLEWSAEPALFVRVPYGPERGQRFDALDEATLDRLAAASGSDIAFSARTEKTRRVTQPVTTASANPLQGALEI
jgi:exodeoxyribonuclease X